MRLCGRDRRSSGKIDDAEMNCGGSVGSIVTDSALIRVIPFGAELCPP